MNNTLRTLVPALITLLAALPLRSAVIDTNRPVIAAVLPSPGTLSNLASIRVTFSEPVTGVSADLLLVNGHAADTVTGTNTTYTFKFLQPNYGTIMIGWDASQEIMDLAIPPNRFNPGAPGATWQYTLVDATPPVVSELTPPDQALLRRLGEVEVIFSESVAGVDASDLLINGQPATNVLTLPVNRYRFQFPEPAPGPVSVRWASDHGIADLAEVPNAFGGGAWAYQLATNASTADLVINEILACNQNGLTDEDKEQQGWIELLNRGTNTVNLSGWSLSDDPAEPGAWVFPARTLGPGQYLVVFASGKDRTQPTGTNRMHTNFKLTRMGNFLGLYTPDSPRLLVSAFDPQYPEQRNDCSYGYDDAGQLRYFAPPTPGRSNGASTVRGMAAPVHFSVPRGHYNQPFDLYLSSETPGAMICFSTDGSEPGVNTGQFYTAPLRVASTIMVRAIAYKSDFLPSRVSTHTYLYNQSAATRSLPIISLVTASNNLIGTTGIIGMGTNGLINANNHGIAWERPVSAEYIRPDDNSGFQVDCGLRVQGSDYQRPRTTPTSKFSFRLYFRGTYGDGRLDYPLFPLSTVHSFNQVVLRAGFNDPDNPFIRDEFSRRLLHDTGQASAHGTLVNLFINGVSKGYYNPTERVNEDFAQTYHGGSPDWDIVSPTWAISSGALGVVDGDRQAFQTMVTFINRSTSSVPAQYLQIEQKLDLVNFVDYLLVNIYAAMGDWPDNNFRVGRDRAGGPFRYWVWDGEWACGIYGRSVTMDTFALNSAGPDGGGLASIGNAEIAQIYQKLRASPEFRLLFADRIQKQFFNGGALTDTNIIARFNQLRTNMIGVLPGMDTTILTTWVPQRRPAVMKLFGTYGYSAYSNAPVLSQFGGLIAPGFTLTMSNRSGAIYYTTNGTDPRVRFTDSPAPDARTYAGPVSLNQSCTVRARSLQGTTNWSALTEAAFQLAWLGTPLRITEVNYNPPGGNACEFIELQNVGGSAVDLSGMYFEGINFTFTTGAQLAPGAVLVLASDNDTNAFRLRYPGVTVAGFFGGALNNGGERITLRDRTGLIVCTVQYDNKRGWPNAADGAGASLEIVDPLGDPDAPANWRASSVGYGTPGAVTPPPLLGPVVINEIMATNQTAVPNAGAYPDWIELRNTTDQPVDLGLWSLSDDANPLKFVLPAGLSLPPQGYLVIWCDDATNTTPGLHAGFALSHAGESLFLYNASTSLVDAVSFGLQVPDYSLGRIDGLWQLSTPTPGAPNAPADTASVTNLAINEWLANALPAQTNWLELFNRADLPVPLQGCYLATTNGLHRLSGLAFVPPRGFSQLFADGGVGPDHLSFALPAAGGSIILYDPLGAEITRATYRAQLPGVAQGRLPDGYTNAVSFPGSASPAAPNYTNSYAGPYLNEVLARNRAALTNGAGQAADYLELYNPSAANFDLGGMSLSVDQSEPGQWRFPTGTVLAGRGYLVIWCDGNQPASTYTGPLLNCGRSLAGESGGVYLFSPAGLLVDAVEYGFQVADLPIGRVGGQWRLLSAATPGATNAPAAALGQPWALRLNEWMAAPADGPDWFELYNRTNLPVELSKLYLSDDVSTTGAAAFPIAPLSFIGAGQCVKWIADAQPEQGRQHVNFALDDRGGGLRLCTATLTNLDVVCFGRQAFNVSQGRLPDGQSNVVSFPGSASPGESNYRLLKDVVISEILLPVATPPFERALELQNTSTNTVDIGGWYLSDTQADFRKYRIPAGTSIPAGGFAVFYQNSFGPSNLLALDPGLGGEMWLARADAAGNLTGDRASARFAPAYSVSVGRVPTSAGVDFVPLEFPTFGIDKPVSVEAFRTGAGATNAYPRVAPVMINEIMYDPPAVPNALGREYVELHNAAAGDVLLYNVFAPAETCRLANAIQFAFPPGIIVPVGGYLLVVDFDPVANPSLLADFRARYGVAETVPVYGPFSGKLNNAGDTVELLAPINSPAPSPTLPLLPVDQVNYGNLPPWPTTRLAGGGFSLQRRSPSLYGNEATNWVAAPPTPGSANAAGAVPPPVVTLSPASQDCPADGPVNLEVRAVGQEPLAYQWRWNGFNLPGATNAALILEDAQPENSGAYDAVVSNPGGSAVSQPARVDIARVPVLISAPTNQTLSVGTKTSFNIVVWGGEPMSYQWRLNGRLLTNATGPTLAFNSLQVSDEGLYEVTVANARGQVAARAALTVLLTPTFLQMPVSQTVVAGGDVVLSVVIEGNPTPFTYTWKRQTAPTLLMGTTVSSAKSNFLAFNTADAGFTLTGDMPSTNYFCRVFVNNLATTPAGVSRSFSVIVLADHNHNGLPDVWETAYESVSGAGLDPSLDSDGDGMANLQEYQAGTNPTNALNLLRLNFTNRWSSPVLSFAAVSNKTYALEYSDALNAATSWNKLADIVARTSNHVETVTDPSWTTNRFYRVITPWHP